MLITNKNLVDNFKIKVQITNSLLDKTREIKD